MHFPEASRELTSRAGHVLRLCRGLEVLAGCEFYFKLRTAIWELWPQIYKYLNLFYLWVWYCLFRLVVWSKFGRTSFLAKWS
jgi:hypothetical protein